MKKYLMMMVLLAVMSTVYAQPPGGPGGGPGRGPNREKVEAMKVGFITQKLNLTPEEAQKFWPIYNRFNDEMEKNRRTFRVKAMEEAGNADNMTDAEADKLLNEMLAFRASEVELLKKYTVEFKKVLPPQKVVKLFAAEQEFKRELLRMLKEQRDKDK